MFSKFLSTQAASNYKNDATDSMKLIQIDVVLAEMIVILICFIITSLFTFLHRNKSTLKVKPEFTIRISIKK